MRYFLILLEKALDMKMLREKLGARVAAVNFDHTNITSSGRPHITEVSTDLLMQVVRRPISFCIIFYRCWWHLTATLRLATS
jgi:hypothetical protein